LGSGFPNQRDFKNLSIRV